MQGTIADLLKVHELKELAVRYKRQNCESSKWYGAGIEHALRELELWDEKEIPCDIGSTAGNVQELSPHKKGHE